MKKNCASFICNCDWGHHSSFPKKMEILNQLIILLTQTWASPTTIDPALQCVLWGNCKRTLLKKRPTSTIRVNPWNTAQNHVWNTRFQQRRWTALGNWKRRERGIIQLALHKIKWRQTMCAAVEKLGTNVVPLTWNEKRHPTPSPAGQAATHLGGDMICSNPSVMQFHRNLNPQKFQPRNKS